MICNPRNAFLRYLKAQDRLEVAISLPTVISSAINCGKRSVAFLVTLDMIPVRCFGNRSVGKIHRRVDNILKLAPTTQWNEKYS